MSDFLERVSKLSPKRLAVLAAKLNAELERLKEQGNEPLAVVGLGCRYPGGIRDAESMWQLLVDRRDAIAEVPAERWDINAYYDPDPEAPGKVNTRNGGFLDSVDQFDPDFFGIAPREAVSMDPQHRLLLETTWRALEDAGISPAALAGSRTGVFIGCGNSDYGRLVFSDESQIDAYSALGSSFSVAAGRLSYILGVHGPALTVDTACSSSLVAVHLACRSLRAAECDLAIVGGVNLMLSPGGTITLSKANMLAPDGRCKAFDASADGFGRAEGCGVVLLKRLSDARADGDRILALVRGSALNQDGRSSGLTAPNGPSQVAVIREALESSGLQPADIDLIEAHGTGTVLGDPIEARALADVFGGDRAADSPLYVGSLKSNIGHAEAAAGIGGLIKTVVALNRGRIPASIHMNRLNPYIEWTGLSIEVPVEERAWIRGPGRRVAGVSSFGFSGTNVHVVVSDAPPDVHAVRDDASGQAHASAWLLPLSARTEAALSGMAKRFEEHFKANPALELSDVCWTAGTGRAHFEHRLAIVAENMAEVGERLAEFGAGKEHPRVYRGECPGSSPPGVVFMFTGQGSQFPGMARELFRTQPEFRHALEQCAEILEPFLDRPLLEVLFEEPPHVEGAAGHRGPLDQTQYTQPALFALEYALAMMWRSWGVEPAAVVGHSVGEYVAACIAGVFSLEDGLRLIAARGRLMAELPSGGAMAAVLADAQRVQSVLTEEESKVCRIACYNGPANVVLSGDRAVVEAAVERLRKQGVESTPLAVSHAFHSPLMEPMLDEFMLAAEQVNYSPPGIAIVSNLTGGFAPPDLMTSAGYWRRHVLEPVRFTDSMDCLIKAGHALYLEIGPHPVLTAMARAGTTGAEIAWTAGLQRGRADWDCLLEAAAAIYVRGVDLDWKGFHGGRQGRRLALPGHPFDRRRFWLERDNAGRSGAGSTSDSPWQQARKAGLHQSRNAPIGVNIERFSEKWECLGQLTTAHAADTLRSLGAFAKPGESHDGESLAQQLGIQPIYGRMLQRWLERMADAGILRADHGQFTRDGPIPAVDLAAQVTAAETVLADDPHFLAYIRNCGQKLTDILAGRESPLETLFPGGSSTLAENLYEGANINRYTNAIAGAVIEAASRGASAARPIRVLEVGGGTGGTSATLLPLLASRPCEYIFTDLSDLFLGRAREKFAGFPFVRFGVCNLDLDLETQGYSRGSFDVIVGANVVHASRDLNAALDGLNRLLAPGGFLLLVEATQHHAWFDFTTGVIEGWQHFADDLRDDNPLLPPERWEQALRRHGFDEVEILPGEGSPAEVLGQHVILARTGRDAQPMNRPAASVEPVVKSSDDAPGTRAEPLNEVAVGEMRNRLLAAGDDERREIMLEYVRARVMEVLRLDEAHRPGRQHRLMDLGLDSLMAVQLRNRLESGLGLERFLPATLMFDYPTIDAIAGYLLQGLFAADDEAPVELAESADGERRAREIEELSDEEAEARLMERLERK